MTDGMAKYQLAHDDVIVAEVELPTIEGFPPNLVIWEDRVFKAPGFTYGPQSTVYSEIFPYRVPA